MIDFGAEEEEEEAITEEQLKNKRLVEMVNSQVNSTKCTIQ